MTRTCAQCGSTELRQDGLGTICINGHDQPDDRLLSALDARMASDEARRAGDALFAAPSEPRPCQCGQHGNWCERHPDCVCGCPRHAHYGWTGECVASSWFCAGCTAYRSGPVNPSIRIWSFWDAPPEYRRLSTAGGDEDWLAFVPASITSEPPWFEYVATSNDVSRYPTEGGTVIIWTHA